MIDRLIDWAFYTGVTVALLVAALVALDLWTGRS